MATCSKKVRIVGKYSTRYSASLWKMVKKIEMRQHVHQVHFLVLWQEQDEEPRLSHLALWLLHENWLVGLDLLHFCHQKTKGTERPARVLLVGTSPASNKWVNLHRKDKC